MSTIGDALGAIRTVLLLQDKVTQLTDAVTAQGKKIQQLTDAHGDLRDRVSRLEGVIEGAAMATRQRRLEE